MNFVSKITNNQSSVVCFLTSVFRILSSVSFFGFLSSAVCPLSSVFMQNKPNSPIVQLNVTLFITMNYAIFASLTKVKNKPNSNPNKPNFKIPEVIVDYLRCLPITSIMSGTRLLMYSSRFVYPSPSASPLRSASSLGSRPCIFSHAPGMPSRSMSQLSGR